MSIFDERINRIGTHSDKWDALTSKYNIDADDGLAMWIADTDFKAPQAVRDAISAVNEHGIFGYYGDQTSYLNAICGWMQRRHNWTIDPSWIFTTHGLGNAVAMSIQTWTKPSDGIILFTPVYHSFARYIKANDRRVVESILINNDGHYEFDLQTLEQNLTGDEKMMIFCSPHNPGGRAWSLEELKAICDFCIKHDIVLVSDEIHHDLVFAGSKHIPMPAVSSEIKSRLVMLTAASKTFNIAGTHCGNVIIEDEALRAQFDKTIKANGISPNSFGLVAVEAAYNFGDEWVDEQVAYIAENKRVFDAGINAIPGLRSMNLEATYLAWVDFTGTGMNSEEFTARVEKGAKIATSRGFTFGSGGESFLRFNLGAPRSVIEEAVRRMQEAFSDMQ